jgi:hypothetical protein
MSSATVFLQQVIDRKILPDQRQAAAQGVRCLLGREPLQTAVADAIVLAQVTIDGFQTVVRLPSDDVRLFAFGIALPANDPLMSQPCSNIVKRGTPRDQGVGVTLMLGQQLGDPTIVGMKQFGEVAVGEETALLVSLLAEAEGLVQEALGSGQALDPPLHILGGGEVEKDRDKLGVRDPLAVGGWVIDADSHPQRLAVCEVFLGAHVLGDDL